MAKPYHIHPKHVGIGGIRCSCCRRTSTVKGTRVALNRAHRRSARQLLRQEA